MKIFGKLLEIIFKLVLRYFLIFVILYIMKYIFDLTDSLILFTANCTIWSEIILYEIWNSKKTIGSYLFGLILSWLFLITIFNYFNLDWKEYEMLIWFQIFESFISLYYFYIGYLPNSKLLISDDDSDEDENNDLNFN